MRFLTAFGMTRFILEVVMVTGRRCRPVTITFILNPMSFRMKRSGMRNLLFIPYNPSTLNRDIVIARSSI